MIDLTHFKHYGKQVFLLALVCLLVPEIVYATPYAAASGGTESYCPADGTLFGRVITCLELTIKDAALFFIIEFYPVIREVVFYAMMLAVCLFGVMMAMGAIERIARDTMFFLLKFGGVVYFMDNVEDLYIRFTDMLAGTLDAIANETIYYGSALKCESTGSPEDGTTLFMWQRADCIFDMIVGLSSAAALSGTDGSEGLSRGMMGFFYYNLQSGALGMLIGVVGLYIAFNLLMALFKAAYTYIIALITLSFLFIIGAIFIPLIMFKNTFEYFSRWVKMILATILQPLILFAYLNVLFVAFDVMLYSGPNSLMRTIAGSAVDAPDFNIHKYAEDNALYGENTKGFTFDMDQRELETSTPEVNDGVFGNIEFTDLKPDYSIQSIIPIDLRYQTVDYTKIPGGAAALAGATLLVGLSSYILLTFMKDIPALAQDLGGGAYETPHVIAGRDVQLPFSGAAQQLGGNLNRGMRGQFDSLVGNRS